MFVILHWIDLQRPLPLKPGAVLDHAECERASRFVFEADARRWIHYRTALRLTLGLELGADPAELKFIASDFGKGRLAAPHQGVEFNVSHSERLAALAISRGGPVGVDLEPLDRARGLLDLAAAFCHPEEIAQLPDEPQARAYDLIKIWTGKEALLKALGIGLMFPPQEILIEDDRGRAHLSGLDDFRLLRPPERFGHLAAVAVTNEISHLVERST